RRAGRGVRARGAAASAGSEARRRATAGGSRGMGGARPGRGRVRGPASHVGEGRPGAQRRRLERGAGAFRRARAAAARSREPSPRHRRPARRHRRPRANREPRRAFPLGSPRDEPGLAPPPPAVAGRAGHPCRDGERRGAGAGGGLRVSETPSLPEILYDELVRRALREDDGRAAVVARQAGRIAGLAPALHAFRLLDPGTRAEICKPDGSDARAGETVARVSARARAILTGERTALNLLGRLSGIATATREAVARLSGLPTRVACTRKTTPGLRALEKYAVRVGGGETHRYGLDDAILIKDNHIALAGDIRTAI